MAKDLFVLTYQREVTTFWLRPKDKRHTKAQKLAAQWTAPFILMRLTITKALLSRRIKHMFTSTCVAPLTNTDQQKENNEYKKKQVRTIEEESEAFSWGANSTEEAAPTVYTDDGPFG